MANLCLMLEILLLYVFVIGCYAESEIPCPENCTCPTTNKLICKRISSIPVFRGKGDIHLLQITNHSITEIKAGDFDNFTHLEQLTISGGNIETIEADAFREIVETLTRLELTSNHIKSLDKDTFSNFPLLSDLELNFNDLKKLETGTFTNLSELKTLKIEFNAIKELEDDVFKNVQNLQTLVFYSNQLTTIPWNGVRGLKGLKLLDVGNNKIGSVGENTNVFFENLNEVQVSSNPLWKLGTFPNVSKSLTIINIGFTHIVSVNKHTWQNVPQLEHLSLSGTQFCEITNGMFTGLAHLKALLLTDMDKLMIVGPHAFAGLDQIHTIDLSRNKKLSTVHEDAFVDTQVSTVELFLCGITSFSEKLFRWKEMKSIIISPNPITCDCHVKWMSNGSMFGNNTDAAQLKCTLPEQLAGHRVVSLNPSSFICTQPLNQKSRVVTGLVVALVVAIVFTTLALVFRFRHQITIRCRRFFMYRRYRNDMIFTVENDTAISELEDAESRPLDDMRLETVPLEVNA